MSTFDLILTGAVFALVLFLLGYMNAYGESKTRTGMLSPPALQPIAQTT